MLTWLAALTFREWCQAGVVAMFEWSKNIKRVSNDFSRRLLGRLSTTNPRIMSQIFSRILLPDFRLLYSSRSHIAADEHQRGCVQ